MDEIGSVKSAEPKSPVSTFPENEPEPRLCVVGIDPGSTGALALLDYQTGEVLQMVRIPHYKIVTGSGNRSRLDCAAVKNLISDWQFEHNIVGIICEALHAVGGFSCHVNFGFGSNMSGFEMLCACFQVPFETVKATEWQKHHFPHKGTHDKERSRQKVNQTHPNLSSQLQHKNTADLAEAVLIAEYAISRNIFRTYITSH